MIAIDLGSNSFRCIEYDCETKMFGRSFERIVGTADRMHQTGRISDEAVRRVAKALEEADAALDLSGSRVKAVTTHAMRRAANSEQVIEDIKEQSGIAFEIISSDDEAYYTLVAVEARLKALKIESSDFVLIDVGGGSSEIIFYRDGRMQSRSFPIGIVTTAQTCSAKQEIESYLAEQFKEVAAYIADYYATEGKPTAYIATAGTPTTMAAYLMGMNHANYDVEKINGYCLTYDGTQKALDDLTGMSERQRAEIVGTGRERLIIAGIVIVQKLYTVLGFDEAIVIDDGVREGVAIDYCQESERAQILS
ncbi:MAG: phosphatase [Thiovulaceae bacterium]|nr:phosphatase [Sulfurimonadaceae bacterium]